MPRSPLATTPSAVPALQLASLPAGPFAARRATLGVRGRLVLLVVAVLAPFLVAAAVRIQERAATARADAARQALAAAQGIAERLDDRVRNTRTLLAALAHQVRTDSAGT